jgi:glycine/D-amino acid oxidase-like deaminating enzyme
MVSIWEQEAFFATQDVIIIGGGFAGLWSAFYIKKKNPGVKITLLDKSPTPAGASTRNAGFACFGSLSELMYDAKTMGVDKMLELVAMRYKGLQRIQKHFGKGIDFHLCGGYELFYEPTQYRRDELESSARYLNALLKPVTGKKNTFLLADEDLLRFGFSTAKHLVKNNLEGYLDSGKLVKHLLEKIQGMGVQVFHGVEVKSFEKRGSVVHLETAQQLHFTTNQLLICTNAFAKDLLPQANITPARGQVLVTSPIKNLPFNGTFHSEEGFYYFRNLGNRVLLGGGRNKAFADEETVDQATSPFIQQELERYLAEVILPACKEPYTIEYRWAGIMGMGADKIPVVKKAEPGVFYAIGLGGMGVALAPVLGEKAAKLLLEH